MPRTKQTRKRNSSLSMTEESELLIKDLKRQAKARLRKIESDYELMWSTFSNLIDMTLSKFSPEARQLTLGQLLHSAEEDDWEDISSTNDNVTELVPPSTVKPKKSKRQTAASDDGYATETGNGQRHVSRVDAVTSTTQKTRKTRSSSRTAQRTERTRESSSKRGVSTSRMNNRFITPAVQKPATEFNVVTPKIKPNTPLNVLRRPREGEMVLSMQGSPILVSAIVQERTANINVPLANGNVISLLPNDGAIRKSQIGSLDEETLRQLETLKGHIEKVINRR